jgi:hypothetical protein
MQSIRRENPAKKFLDDLPPQNVEAALDALPPVEASSEETSPLLEEAPALPVAEEIAEDPTPLEEEDDDANNDDDADDGDDDDDPDDDPDDAPADAEDDEGPDEDDEDYDMTWRKADLVALAIRKGIPDADSMTKVQIIDALNALP